jgi:hypothetical protein
MLELQLLPARQGDAIWIRWGSASKPRQLLIDMGTCATGELLRKRLKALKPAERTFELLVVTHMDCDHIGGVLSCVAEAEELEGLRFNDVWFNGWRNINGKKVKSTLENWGPPEGERLSTWLRDYIWNDTFDGAPVIRGKDGVWEVTLDGGLRLTVLGPPKTRLTELVPVWKTEVKRALKDGRLDPGSGLERWGATDPPKLKTHADLEALAKERENDRDDTEANGSSIALLLEYEDRRIALTGDAFADDLVEAFAALSSEPLELDAFKLPHHGSRNNVTKELINAVSCPLWLFSTDGTQFRHPHKQAVARVILHGGDRPMLGFNVPSTYNGWWDRSDWRRKFKYRTMYGDAEDGLWLVFD